MNNKIIKKQMIMYKRSKMFVRIKLTIENYIMRLPTFSELNGWE